MIVLYYILAWLVMGVIFTVVDCMCFTFPREVGDDGQDWDWDWDYLPEMLFAIILWPLVVYWIITDREVK